MKITKKQHAELPAWLRKTFTVNPDDADEYDNGETDEDVAGLKSTLEKERTARKTNDKELKRLKDEEKKRQEEADDADDELPPGDGKPPKTGNVAKDKRAADRWAAEKKEMEDKVQAANDRAGKALVDSARDALAKELFVKPGRDAVHLAGRLGYELDDDGVPSLVVLGTDGKAMVGKSTKDLSKEILANKEYSGIVIASKATGAGGVPVAPGTPTGMDGKPDKDAKPADLTKLTAKEIVAEMKRNGTAPVIEGAE